MEVSVRYLHEAVGINSRLDALQAAVLHVKLKYLDQWTEGRRRNAERYERLFAQAQLLDRVLLPVTTPETFTCTTNTPSRCGNEMNSGIF